MKILNPEKPILLLGDHHGAWTAILDIIDSKRIENCNIISVGDMGIGFRYRKEHDHEVCSELNSKFKQKNINFYGIRGNHDAPSFFKGNGRICFDNFELIEDYSIYEYRSKKIQFIGGAVSLDRTGRTMGVSYWDDECVTFNKDACKKVDIAITHTAPSFCAPQGFNEMVYGWAREDAYLIDDLNDERAIMDEIFKICDPSYHFYGHFHFSHIEKINKCNHRLLDINEFFEFKI